MASHEHGDARKAIALLAKSAYLAEKAGTKVTLTLVAKAATELDRDRYLTLVHSTLPLADDLVDRARVATAQALRQQMVHFGAHPF